MVEAFETALILVYLAGMVVVAFRFLDGPGFVHEADAFWSLAFAVLWPLVVVARVLTWLRRLCGFGEDGD